MKRNNIKKIPQFNNENDEARFWLEHDFTEYYDPSKRVRLHFPNLKPSTQSVTVRLPKPMVRLLKRFANEQDIPYQSLLKTYLDEKIRETLILKKKTSNLRYA